MQLNKHLWAVVCDFDGTISSVDVTDKLLATYAGPEWLGVEEEWRNDIGNLCGTEIFGDKELLAQMFANLIENAIRHCPPSTDISLIGAVTASGPIVTVIDNGPGIPEFEQKKVFQRLYRVDKSRSTPGNGLGLALVLAIVELHEAQISLSSANPGLRATIRFPALSRQPLAAAE